jgi:hypothetical protein
VRQADEFHVIGDPSSDRFAVLYRRGDHLAGAFTVGLPALLIKAPPSDQPATALARRIATVELSAQRAIFLHLEATAH